MNIKPVLYLVRCSRIKLPYTYVYILFQSIVCRSWIRRKNRSEKCISPYFPTFNVNNIFFQHSLETMDFKFFAWNVWAHIFELKKTTECALTKITNLSKPTKTAKDEPIFRNLSIGLHPWVENTKSVLSECSTFQIKLFIFSSHSHMFNYVPMFISIRKVKRFKKLGIAPLNLKNSRIKLSLKTLE